MTEPLIRTVIALDDRGNERAVHCRVFDDNGERIHHDTQSYKAMLRESGLKFDGFVYDLADNYDRNTVAMYFLSPNVWGKMLWVTENDHFIKRMVKREELD